MHRGGTVRTWLSRHRAAAIAAAAMVAVVAVVAGLVAACGGRTNRATAPTTGPSATAPPAVNPLTGEAGVPGGPVVGVKVDNTRVGRPQWGLNQADVVYVEQVEGGLTRLIAIYDAARAPTRVG